MDVTSAALDKTRNLSIRQKQRERTRIQLELQNEPFGPHRGKNKHSSQNMPTFIAPTLLMRTGP
jgi:hypothetical protein